MYLFIYGENSPSFVVTYQSTGFKFISYSMDSIFLCFIVCFVIPSHFVFVFDPCFCLFHVGLCILFLTYILAFEFCGGTRIKQKPGK